MTAQPQTEETIIQEIIQLIAPIKSIMAQNKRNVEQAEQQTREAVIVHAIANAKTCAETASKFAFLLTRNMAQIQAICDAKYQEIDAAEQRNDLSKEVAKKAKKQIEAEIIRKIKREIVEPTKCLAANATKIIEQEESPVFQLNNLNSFAMLGIKLVMAIGFLFIFFYCVLILQWMPIGMSLSETAGILLMGLSVSAFFLCSILPLAMFFVKRINKAEKLPNKRNIWIIIAAITILFCTSIFIGIKINQLPTSMWFVIIVLFVGISIVALRDVNTLKIQIIQIITPLIAFCVIFSTLFSYKPILAFLGFAHPQATIQLNDADFKLVQTQAQQQGFTDIKFDKENRVVSPVDIKLRGIGTHTLIELRQEVQQTETKKEQNNTPQEKTIRFEIKTSESTVIQVKLPE